MNIPTLFTVTISGSAEERAAVERACKHTGVVSLGVYEEPEKLVDFKLITPKSVPMGEDFDIRGFHDEVLGKGPAAGFSANPKGQAG